PSSHTFYASVPSALKPSSSSSIADIPVYSCVEASASPDTGENGVEEEQNTWRGGWSKRFIPDELVYETSMQNTATGMFAITHAPMGVHSVTTWTVKTETGTGCVLEKEGKVTSNRMLMAFIKTTLQESYDRLARDFVVMLQKEVEKKREGDGEMDKGIVAQPAAVEQPVEALA
ncbi:hypothetical protein LOCC1_G004526, partial [Lachnellula occidentalis]